MLSIYSIYIHYVHTYANMHIYASIYVYIPFIYIKYFTCIFYRAIFKQKGDFNLKHTQLKETIGYRYSIISNTWLVFESTDRLLLDIAVIFDILLLQTTLLLAFLFALNIVSQASINDGTYRWFFWTVT